MLLESFKNVFEIEIEQNYKNCFVIFLKNRPDLTMLCELLPLPKRDISTRDRERTFLLYLFAGCIVSVPCCHVTFN